MGTNESKTSLSEDEMLHSQSQKPKEEIRFWYEHFIQQCPSGKMDRNKFVEYYKLFKKDQNNIELITDRCFEAFDSDKNGFVDFREFLVAYATTSGGIFFYNFIKFSNLYNYF